MVQTVWKLMYHPSFLSRLQKALIEIVRVVSILRIMKAETGESEWISHADIIGDGGGGVAVPGFSVDPIYSSVCRPKWSTCHLSPLIRFRFINFLIPHHINSQE